MMHQWLLAIHIGSGSLALFSGLLSITARKGQPAHRLAGQVFAPSLLISSLASLGLCLLRPNTLLWAIGWATIYLVLSGWAYAGMGPGEYRGGRLVAFFGMFPAGLTGAQVFMGTPGFSLVLPLFIALQLWLVYSDFRPVKDRRDRIGRHAGRMGGAYIATVTAFLVVSVEALPWYVSWFGPTVAGSLLIRHALRQYNKKGASTQREAPISENRLN